MGGLFSSVCGAERPLRRRGGRAGPYEPLFFPDVGLPCRNWLAGKECRHGHCRFVHEETGLSRILAVLAGAKRTIDAAVFSISQKELADALEAAHRRGVAVRLITDDKEAEHPYSLVGRLRAAGIGVRTDDSQRLHMHHKFAVVDAELLLNGSFNWTSAAVQRSNENVVINFDRALAGSFAKEFDRLWTAFGRDVAGTAMSSAPAKGDMLTSLFFPDASGTNVDVILSEILAARRSIHVAMFCLTLDKLADALMEKHTAGVEVRVITDYRQSSCIGGDARRLLDAGLPLHVAPSGHTMHHKFAIIDSSVLVNGSFNWTAQASRGNQEDAVVYRRCGQLAASFESEFERLWASSRRAA